MGRVIRRAQGDTTVGVDHHNGLYYMNLFTGLAPWAPPFIPAPLPPGMVPSPVSFHAILANAAYSLGVEDNCNPTVLAEGAPVVSKNHAAKYVIHVPPGGNILAPLICLLGSATWKLAVGSVLGAQGPLASTLAGPIGFTVNCGDPCSMPTGVAISCNSVHIDPSPWDVAVCHAEWMFTAVIELALSFAFMKAGDAAKRLIARKLASAAQTSAARSAIKEALSDKAIREFVDENFRGISKRERKRWEGYIGRKLVESAKEKGVEAASGVMKGDASSYVKYAAEGGLGTAENVAGNKANELVDKVVPDEPLKLPPPGDPKR